MDKKRLAINMAAQLLAFAVNMGISFFLAPIIEAQMANTYGFVTLANQFVLYAQIVVSALNTMASRFVTIHIHRGEEQEAREYFSSVFFGNVIMAGIFLLPALVIVIFIGKCACSKKPAGTQDESSMGVMTITVAPSPTPTEVPRQVSSDAAVTNGNVTMVNEYLVQKGNDSSTKADNSSATDNNGSGEGSDTSETNGDGSTDGTE